MVRVCCVAVALGLLAEAHLAAACSPLRPADLAALPATGATEVSPLTSIVVVTGSSIPVGLAVEENGRPVATSQPEAFGEGRAGIAPARFWRVGVTLHPSSSYVVRGGDSTGVIRELTRFTTAASSDSAPGMPPALERLRLWRIRYPADQIRNGGCVLGEYQTYIDLDYQPGALPGTPPAEIVHVLSLRPKTAGSVQTFVFSGLHFDGATTDGPADANEIPEGGLPYPASAVWKPVLAPDREYCATLALFGRNDLAMEIVNSKEICSPVMNVDTTSGGCSVAGGRAAFPGIALFLLIAVAGGRRIVRSSTP